eukprot:scaffold10991_cov35-Phaeocystis_antarctica.AAC.1
MSTHHAECHDVAAVRHDIPVGPVIYTWCYSADTARRTGTTVHCHIAHASVVVVELRAQSGRRSRNERSLTTDLLFNFEHVHVREVPI